MSERIYSLEVKCISEEKCTITISKTVEEYGSKEIEFTTYISKGILEGDCSIPYIDFPQDDGSTVYLGYAEDGGHTLLKEDLCTIDNIIFSYIDTSSEPDCIFNTVPKIYAWQKELTGDGKNIFSDEKIKKVIYGTAEHKSPYFQEVDCIKTWTRDLPYLETTCGQRFYDDDRTGEWQWKANLDKLTIADNMFNGSQKIVSFFVPDELNTVSSAKNMFYNAKSLKRFNADLNSITGELSETSNGAYQMFWGASSLTYFNAEFKSLKDFSFTFDGCTSVQTFISNLPLIQDVSFVESMCLSLVTYQANMDSLETTCAMFRGDEGNGFQKLKTFQSYTPNNKMANEMFYNNVSLETVTFGSKNDLSKLVIANSMFEYCCKLYSYRTGATDGTFDYNLTSLKEGNFMFRGNHELVSFTYTFENLCKANGMFKDCPKLTIEYDIQNLKDISYFYAGELITSASVPAGNYTSAQGIFEGCCRLSSVSATEIRQTSILKEIFESLPKRSKNGTISYVEELFGDDLQEWKNYLSEKGWSSNKQTYLEKVVVAMWDNENGWSKRLEYLNNLEDSDSSYIAFDTTNIDDIIIS